MDASLLLPLYTGRMTPIKMSGGMCSRWTKALKICFSHRVRRAPPYLRCSGWRLLIPPAFLAVNLFRVSSTSSTVKKSSTTSSLLSLDSEVRVGTFLHTSATSGLEWDWQVAMDEKWFVHWARTNWGSEVMLPLMRSLSPREGWLGGILKRLGLSSLKNCSLFT